MNHNILENIRSILPKTKFSFFNTVLLNILLLSGTSSYAQTATDVLKQQHYIQAIATPALSIPDWENISSWLPDGSIMVAEIGTHSCGPCKYAQETIKKSLSTYNPNTYFLFVDMNYDKITGKEVRNDPKYNEAKREWNWRWNRSESPRFIIRIIKSGKPVVLKAFDPSDLDSEATFFGQPLDKNREKAIQQVVSKATTLYKNGELRDKLKNNFSKHQNYDIDGKYIWERTKNGVLVLPTINRKYSFEEIWPQ